ncbi:uncharacterized protein EV420DRAFT_20928 [Desarmillaria tabescens]|uniref:F-box domain-containing protein n=1 Tax=Armillaria tabescens TaxID=1929756 RepID=A0AA39NP68_ARMTA|nr:uncharacterized protein EV420DRAFT_20928 [Desarmillaria tabescens]KAK0469282.1 hypothetical protein EV420DRAFT_20928 [Desarmillaria tabescens]
MPIQTQIFTSFTATTTWKSKITAAFMYNDIGCPQCGFCLSTGARLPDGIPSDRANQLLSSNEPPIGDELEQCEEILSNGSEFLRSLNRSISQARHLLNRLTAESIRIEHKLHISKTLMNPVRRLPCEILEEIFSWGMDDAMNATIACPADSLDARDFLWTVSQVCSSWRCLTLSRPHWWASIRLDLKAGPEKPTTLQWLLNRTSRAPRNESPQASLPPFLAYRFSLHLERSGNHSLSVFVGSKQDISAHPLLPLILSSSPRWRQLHVSFYKAESFRTLEAVSDSLDSLHELRISVYNDHRFPSLWNTTAFRNAPKLQAVTINDRPDFFQLPWSQISNADIGGKLLDVLPEVRTATALTLRPSTKRLTFTTIFSSSHLTRLSLWEMHHHVPQGTIASYFSMMALPKLLSLELHYHGRGTHLPHFGRRSLPSLTSLLISAPSKTLDWSDACTVLPALSSLESLSLEVIIDSDEIFHTLVSEQPSLRRLDLTGSQMSFDHRELVNMLDGRRTEERTVLDELVLPSPLMIVDSEDWRWSNVWILVVTGGLNVVCRSHRSTIYIIPDETADVADAPSASLLHTDSVHKRDVSSEERLTVEHPRRMQGVSLAGIVDLW